MMDQVLESHPAGYLEEPLKKIRRAWIAALISAGITLALVVAAITGSELMNYSAWQLADVALILGLAFGIYKKSRTCAVFLLIYFIGSKVLEFFEAGRAAGVPVALIFAFFYLQGVVGTFSYHRRMKIEASTGGA